MKIALTVIASLAALVVAFIVWRLVATVRGGQRAYATLLARIAPITQALARGATPAREALVAAARDRNTRKVLFETLSHLGKSELFPSEFRTWDAFAESDLVAWLNHPNELAATPDEIELMGRLPVTGADGATLHYFLFRYRTHEPHWAAKDGWLAGLAGPYDCSRPPEPHAPGTFSRFEAYDSRTPEEHVQVTHRLVVERRGS